ncbi:hypothetical protein [Schaalia sp. lx-100]|uniref:hypothetical protein n=1 Tax=Schaalia sp. lx-100 TaxID=2899081 RepID=UPI001E28E090|nr:hypothetical protein [Schaalia sp. lx-100]MCD4557641.1 hypothetical protein [Schaalia sp. lx-100]
MIVNRVGFATLDEELSGVVRAELARFRLDQKEIANKIQMHPNVFGRKCRGEVAFSTGELTAVAHAIGTTASALTHEAEVRFTKAVDVNPVKLIDRTLCKECFTK